MRKQGAHRKNTAWQMILSAMLAVTYVICDVIWKNISK